MQKKKRKRKEECRNIYMNLLQTDNKILLEHSKLA